MGGEEWFVERAGRNNQCQCSSGVVLCVAESDAVEAAEIPRVKQCQDNAGGRRAVGDVWQDECNSCKCNEGGVPGCTKKLCPTASNGCIDRLGEARKEGEAWIVERAGRNNQCQCR